jgi:hypothetical protein
MTFGKQLFSKQTMAVSDELYPVGLLVSPKMPAFLT